MTKAANENDLSIKDLNLVVPFLGRLILLSHTASPLKIYNYPELVKHIRECSICSRKFKLVFREILFYSSEKKGGE